MILVALSAALVGFFHSLAPGHWLPVILTTKARRWSVQKALLGALVAALGHILISILLGVLSIELGAALLSRYEPEIEHYAGLGLAAFGLIYGTLAFFRHSSCVGHTHHGPQPKPEKAPFLFLFSVGFSPCVAALPVFAAAAPHGVLAVALTLVAFAMGVITALAGATLLVTLGLVRLDHPFLEHYGDVMTGAGVALLGIAIFLLPGA